MRYAAKSSREPVEKYLGIIDVKLTHSCQIRKRLEREGFFEVLLLMKSLRIVLLAQNTMVTPIL